MRRRNPPPPASAGGADNWQHVVLDVTEADQRAFTLPFAAALDGDDDPKARIEYSGASFNSPADFTISGTTLTWAGTVSLDVGESLTLWIAPQSA